MARRWLPRKTRRGHPSDGPQDPVGNQSLALLQAANCLKADDPDAAIAVYREIVDGFAASSSTWARQHAKTAAFEARRLLAALGRHVELDAMLADDVGRAEGVGDVALVCSLLHDRAEVLFLDGKYEEAAAVCRDLRLRAAAIDEDWRREHELYRSYRGEAEALAALGRSADVAGLVGRAAHGATWPSAWTLRLRLLEASAMRDADGAEAIRICDSIIAEYERDADDTDPSSYNTGYQLQAVAAEAMILKADVLAAAARTEEALRLYAATAARFAAAYEEQRDSEDWAARSLALEARLLQGRLLRSIGRFDDARACFVEVQRAGSHWPSLQPQAAVATEELNSV